MLIDDDLQNLISENQRLQREIDILNFKLTACYNGKLNYMFPLHWGLTSREANMLYALYNRAVYTKKDFMQEFYYSRNVFVLDKIYDVYISRLRKKIRILQLPIEITTDWGVGYFLSEDSKIFISQYILKIRSYEDMQMSFDRQPWHSSDEKQYMLHEQAIAKLKSLNTKEIPQEIYAIAYARLCGFIRDQAPTLLSPLEN